MHWAVASRTLCMDDENRRLSPSESTSNVSEMSKASAMPRILYLKVAVMSTVLVIAAAAIVIWQRHAVGQPSIITLAQRAPHRSIEARLCGWPYQPFAGGPRV